MKRFVVPAVVLGICLTGCGSASEGDGTLRFTAYGEDFIEQEIPAEVFVDGWRVEFSSFIVALGGLSAGDASVPGTFIVELARPSAGTGHTLEEIGVPSGTAPTIAYSLVPPSAEAITDLDDATLTAMVASGASVWARGVATKGDVTISFDWPLDVQAQYVNCETEERVAEAQTVEGILTIHADHLFYDDLDSSEPNVAFDLIAESDADGDGNVTIAELGAQSIATQERYQVGSRDIDDLYGFILAQAGTVGHINGEGHCDLE